MGEQRVEFTPTDGGTADPVPDGGRVPAAEDATPPEISEVLDTANDLITALPADDLNTLVHEAVVAIRGREDELAGFASDIDTFNQAFLDHEDGFRDLLRTSPRLLDALTEVAPEFRQALANTAVLSGTLAERSQDLTDLMVNGAEFAEVAGPLLESQMANLGCLFSDAADLNEFLADPAVLRNLQLGLDLNTGLLRPDRRPGRRGPRHRLPAVRLGGAQRPAVAPGADPRPAGQPDGESLHAAPPDPRHPARRGLQQRLRAGCRPGHAGRGRLRPGPGGRPRPRR